MGDDILKNGSIDTSKFISGEKKFHDKVQYVEETTDKLLDTLDKLQKVNGNLDLNIDTTLNTELTREEQRALEKKGTKAADIQADAFEKQQKKRQRARKTIKSESEIEDNLYTVNEGGVEKLKRGKKHVDPLRTAYKKSLPREDVEYDYKFIKEFTKVKQLNLLNALDESERKSMEAFYNQILAEDKKFQDVQENALKKHTETIERLNQAALQRVQEATQPKIPEHKTEVLSGDGVAESFDKAEEKIESVNEKLQESKKYVNDVRQAFMHVVGRAGDRDALLEQYPELSDFKNRKSVDNARAFLDTDEWNDFLSTLPQAHTYLESIGYDFERIYKLTDEEIAWFKGLDLDELAKHQWSVNGTPDKVDYKEIRAAYQAYLKELSNQTPLSSPTGGHEKTVDEVEEAAKEIEEADEKIEASNEEVKRSEEEVEKKTVKSRKKSSSSAKEHADEVENANKRIAKSNKAVANSENDLLNTTASVDGMKKEADAAEAVKEAMKDAANAKGQFADENKQVKVSTDISTPELQEEEDALDEITDITPLTEEWNKALVSANEYLSLLGDVYNITQKIRTDKDGNRLISYQLTGETGNSVTVGQNGRLISATNKIGKDLDIQKEATTQNEKAAKAYIDLFNKADRYYQLKSKEAAKNILEKESEELRQLEKEWNDATHAVGKYAIAENNLGSQESRDEYDVASSKFKNNSSQVYTDSIKKDIAVYEKFYNTIAANKRGLQPVVEYQQKIDSLKTTINDLRKLEEKGGNLVGSDELKQVEIYKQQIEELKETLRGMKNNKDFVVADPTEGWKKIGDISSILEKNTKMSKEMKASFEALQQKYIVALETGQSQKKLEELNAELAEMEARLKASGRTGKSFFKKVGDAITSEAAQFFATYLSLQDLVQIARQGFEVIKEYDTALTEMNKVSNETISTLKAFQQESFTLADAIGSTAVEIQNSTADFLKLGYSLEDAAKLAESANIYANVGDMGIDEATEHMVSSVKAWSSEFANDIEAAENIVDRYNAIGNSYAITSADIGQAMETSAAALKAGGNTLNESLGLLVSGNLIQQDASTTASALKILSLRVRGAKADLEEMGESTDGLTSSTSKMREEIQALTGVDIMLDDDTFKSTAQIIKEIGAVWENLTDVSQAATLEKLAGKNRASTVSGLLENYKLIDEVMRTAEESQGSALEENQRYIDSIAGSLDRLSNAWDSLWANENSRELITGIVDIGTSILQVVDNIGLLKTALIGLGAGIGVKSAISGGGRVKMFTLRVYEYATGEFSSDVYELCVA